MHIGKAAMDMMHRIRQPFTRSRPRNGQSMVEMALMMPLLFLLILGIIEFSWYIYSYSEVNNAVRRGSEFASKSPPTTVNSRDDNSTDKCAILVKQEIRKYSFMRQVLPDTITLVYPTKPLREVGIPIEVTIRYSGRWLTPLGNTLFDDQMRIWFSSRRTIVNTAPPEGYKDGCIK